MLAKHTRLSCTVPVGEGKAQKAVATVSMLSGSPTGAAEFTYSKVGCVSETAVNYDGNATIDDGSCKILGCTDMSKYNFNPEANQDDGRCEDFPVTVSMRVKGDFQDYLAKKTKYETDFRTEVARNLGIDVARVEVVQVTEGSLIFKFNIYDDPDSKVGVAVAMLEEQVLSNQWESSYTLQSLEVQGSTTGEIVTRADEPIISQQSIIALGEIGRAHV